MLPENPIQPPASGPAKLTQMRRQDGGNLNEQIGRLLRGDMELTFHFQPIVALEQAEVVGYEALVRFPAAMGSAPDQIFAAAGELGRQVELERFVAERGLEFRDSLPRNCFLSINASPTFLFSAQWDTLLSRTGDLSSVVVEITEQNMVHDYPAMRSKVERIRAQGGHIAVDDTGSGYASLKHVMELRPQFIKLDRFFVSGCHTEGIKSVMIKMLGEAADRLDAWIIAEGIEVQPELTELLRLRVPLGQGYFLGRPAPRMGALLPATAEQLRDHGRALRNPSGLTALVERCVVAPSHSHATELLERDLSLSTVAVLDAYGRPVDLLERTATDLRTLTGLMRVQSASSAEQVLQRALVRPIGSQFDPLLVINERGGLEGIVRMERLIRAAVEPKPGVSQA